MTQPEIKLAIDKIFTENVIYGGFVGKAKVEILELVMQESKDGK